MTDNQHGNKAVIYFFIFFLFLPAAAALALLLLWLLCKTQNTRSPAIRNGFYSTTKTWPIAHDTGAVQSLLL
jgi:hypothetical protein